MAVLTSSGLLARNQRTQRLEPALAESWKVLAQGKAISFQLRRGVVFSDGTPFTAEDVRYTIERAIDPKTNSPFEESFRSEEGQASVSVTAPDRLTVTFPAPVANIETRFASLPVQSSQSKENAGLGPFTLAERRAGAFLLFRRNPNYWKIDAASGRRLPYLDSVRVEMQQNRDIERERFRRGDLHLLESIDSAGFERLQRELPAAAVDAGPSTDIEFIWFNQSTGAPIPAYKLAWFRSKAFRRAISEAVHRDDIVRLAFLGRATIAAGPTPSSNQLWYKSGLAPHPFDLASARKRLQQDGFRLKNGSLVDREGHPVEFSLITNAGSTTRSRIASILQQDLAQLGIQLNISTFDFPSLIERISRTQNYEACLLGFVNVTTDPMGQMNTLISSGPQHMWNPSQKQPATSWEAEIDKAMRAQASSPDMKKRKAAFDKVQQILSDEAPVLYLAHRNALMAVSPKVRNATPSVLFPHLVWNVDSLFLQ